MPLLKSDPSVTIYSYPGYFLHCANEIVVDDIPCSRYTDNMLSTRLTVNRIISLKNEYTDDEDLINDGLHKNCAMCGTFRSVVCNFVDTSQDDPFQWKTIKE